MKVLLSLLLVLPGMSSALDLKEAEYQAQQASFKLQAYAATSKSLAYQQDKLNVSLLPKLNINIGSGRQYSPDSAYLYTWGSEIRADFGNPWGFLAQRDQLSAQQSLTELNTRSERFIITHALRLRYFKAQLIHEQIKQARTNLATVEKVATMIENKYYQGRIQILDKDRLLVERSKQRQSLASLSEQLHGELALLALSLERADLNTELLTTLLPHDFEAGFLPPAFTETIAVKRLSLEVQERQAQIALETSRYLPEFFLSYQHHTTAETFLQNQQIMLGVTWSLSAERYYSSKSLVQNQQTSLYSQQDEERQGKIRYADLLSQTKTQIAALTEQKKIVTIYQNIAAESFKQYQRGIISLKDYYEDFRLVLGEEATLLQQRFELVKLFAELALIMENDNVFYQGLRAG